MNVNTTYTLLPFSSFHKVFLWKVSSLSVWYADEGFAHCNVIYKCRPSWLADRKLFYLIKKKSCPTSLLWAIAYMPFRQVYLHWIQKLMLWVVFNIFICRVTHAVTRAIWHLSLPWLINCLWMVNLKYLQVEGRTALFAYGLWVRGQKNHPLIATFHGHEKALSFLSVARYVL